MYEARQNKEKVSRRIDMGKGTCQRAEIGKCYNEGINLKTIQKRAKVSIDYEGININRNGDFRYLDKELKIGGNVYRHMSPKSSRLNLAKSFFINLYQSDNVFQAAQEKLKILQNQLSGFEYYTEHLGSQFAGDAEGNRKLTKGEYDSLLIAAKEKGVIMLPLFIDTELKALAEDYMYNYLSRHANDAESFMKTLQTNQLTLDAMFINSYIENRIKETAEKLNVNPDDVLKLLLERIHPTMIQKAMGEIARAAQKAFLNNEWLGPTTHSGEPSLLYYVQ